MRASWAISRFPPHGEFIFAFRFFGHHLYGLAADFGIDLDEEEFIKQCFMRGETKVYDNSVTFVTEDTYRWFRDRNLVDILW